MIADIHEQASWKKNKYFYFCIKLHLCIKCADAGKDLICYVWPWGKKKRSSTVTLKPHLWYSSSQWPEIVTCSQRVHSWFYMASALWKKAWLASFTRRLFTCILIQRFKDDNDIQCRQVVFLYFKSGYPVWTVCAPVFSKGTATEKVYRGMIPKKLE